MTSNSITKSHVCVTSLEPDPDLVRTKASSKAGPAEGEDRGVQERLANTSHSPSFPGVNHKTLCNPTTLFWLSNMVLAGLGGILQTCQLKELKSMLGVAYIFGHRGLVHLFYPTHFFCVLQLHLFVLARPTSDLATALIYIWTRASEGVGLNPSHFQTLVLSVGLQCLPQLVLIRLHRPLLWFSFTNSISRKAALFPDRRFNSVVG